MLEMVRIPIHIISHLCQCIAIKRCSVVVLSDATNSNGLNCTGPNGLPVAQHQHLHHHMHHYQCETAPRVHPFNVAPRINISIGASFVVRRKSLRVVVPRMLLRDLMHSKAAESCFKIDVIVLQIVVWRYIIFLYNIYLFRVAHSIKLISSGALIHHIVIHTFDRTIRDYA